MTAKRTILCMKWGPDFPPDYVNVLYHACMRNLSEPAGFVCLTDHQDGLDPSIRTRPIPDIGLRAQDWYTPGVWPKLALFSPELSDLGGRCLFIDLDMMITGPLDPFFEPRDHITVLDVGPNWRPGATRFDKEAGTGVFAFSPGGQTQILKAFQTDPVQAMATFQNEQDFVGHHARGLGFWPASWVLSFKRHIARRLGRDLILSPQTPVNVPIVAFHGTPRPVDLLRPGLWGRFPHLGRGPVPWVRDYWLENGGRLDLR